MTTLSRRNSQTSITPHRTTNDLAQRHERSGEHKRNVTPTRDKAFTLLYLLRTSLALRLALAAGVIVCTCIAMIIWLFVRNPVHLPQLDQAIKGDAPQFSASVSESGYQAHPIFDNKTAHVTLYMNNEHPPQTGLSQRLQEQLTLSGILAATVKQESAFSIFDHLDQGVPVLVVGDISSKVYETVTWVTLNPEAFTPQSAPNSGDNQGSSNAGDKPSISGGNDSSSQNPTTQDISLLRFANYYAKVPADKVFNHLSDLTDQQDILDGEPLESYRARASASVHKELLSNSRIALYKGTTQAGVYWAILVEYQDDGMARVCLLEANHPELLTWLIDHKGLL